MFLPPSLCGLLAASVTSLVSPASPRIHTDSVTATGSISGIVTDSAGNPMAGVLITVDNKKLKLHGELLTQGSGQFRFNGLGAGIPFDVGFLHKNYAIEMRYGIVLSVGEERTLNVSLVHNAVSLEAVRVVAEPPKGSPQARKFLGQDEIAKAKSYSALDAIQRLRPMMLANRRGEMCLPPDTAVSLYVNGIRRPLFDPPADDTLGGRTVQSPRSAMEDELRYIRAEDILQVRFIGCEDFDPNIQRRNVIWIILKPWARH